MSWYRGAIRMELQPESDSQPAIRPTQLIFHSITAPWDEKRIYEYWRDSSNLESHFGLDYDGSLGQFIGTQTRADATGAANKRPDGTGAISLESASNLGATDPWTPAQIETMIKLGVWVHKEHGIPLRVCPGPGEPGFGYHRLFRTWNPDLHSCPGDARVKQFHNVLMPGIIARAKNPAPPVPLEDEVKSLSVTSPELTAVEPKQWQTLGFTEKPTILGPGFGYHALVQLRLRDLAPDVKVQGRFFHYRVADGVHSNGLAIDRYSPGSGGDAYLDFSAGGVLDDGYELRFEVFVHNPEGQNASVAHRLVRGSYWTE